MSAAPATAPMEPPRLRYGLAEGTRATSELIWFAAARRWLARGRDGAGRPVLVLPGLNASDRSTAPLRSLLTSIDYDAYGWGLGVNRGPTAPVIAHLDQLLTEIRDEHDGSPVSVIGQSLGGFFALELARRHPGGVERVITLGSPISIVTRFQTRVHRIYDHYSRHHVPEYLFDRWINAPQPPIPASSIYSQSDGIVRGEACRYPQGPLTENIEVYSSHLGMAVQPAAVYAVLDRLQAPLDPWQKFEPPSNLRLYYRHEV